MPLLLAWSTSSVVLLVLGAGGLGVFAGAWLFRPRAEGEASLRARAAERLEAALASETGRKALEALVPSATAAYATALEAVRARSIDTLAAEPTAETDALLATFRRAGKTLVTGLRARPEDLKTVLTAVRPMARGITLGSLVPADAALRHALYRRAWEGLGAPALHRLAGSFDPRRVATPALVLGILEDDALRRIAAVLVRFVSRDRDRLRRLHSAVTDAFGDATLISMGPVVVTIRDVLRRVITPADLQTRLSTAASFLEKGTDPRGRALREAGVDMGLGFVDAWVQLPAEQRQRAVKLVHDRVFPAVFPVIAEMVDDALATLTVADVLDALAHDDDPVLVLSLLGHAERMLEDDRRDALVREALRALPPDVRRSLATLAVDALADAIGPLVKVAVVTDMKGLADRASLARLAGTLAELTTKPAPA